MSADPNRQMVIEVAKRLGPLCNDVVFLGGAATGLLLTDPAAAPVRATDDVDVVVEIGSQREYHALGASLRARGFREDDSEGAPICRWIADGLKLDAMPADPTVLGFSNKWYRTSLEAAEPMVLEEGEAIRLISAPCFLGTKLEAFYGRGQGDYLAADLEDDGAAPLRVPALCERPGGA